MQKKRYIKVILILMINLFAQYSRAEQPDVIYYNANIITMDASQPNGQAIAIANDKIVAVGDNESVMALSNERTAIVNAHGSTIVPGFIDAHAHRIGDRWLWGINDPDSIIQKSIELGWTGIHELFVNRDRLNELKKLDEEHRLRLRVDAYLALASGSDDCGNWIDTFYEEQTPGEMISPYLKLAGVKITLDREWGQCIFFDQDELNGMVYDAHSRGWQIAVHTFAYESSRRIVKAFLEALNGESNETYRHRLEHIALVSDSLLNVIKELRLIASVQLGTPTGMLTEPSFIENTPEEQYNWLVRTRDFIDAGIKVIGSTDAPWGTVDWRGAGGTSHFGSPLWLIYEAVTKKGYYSGSTPNSFVASQAITAEEAIRTMTINAAYATFEDDVRGSLTSGKWADLVFLSDDPTAVDPEEIMDIKVLLTMIGGKTEYLASGAENLNPVSTRNLAYMKPVTASQSLNENPPEYAVDGDRETYWGAGEHPTHWIEVDLQIPVDIERINLITSQYPDGETVHKVWGLPSNGQWSVLYELKGITGDNQMLTFTPSSPWLDIERIHVETTQSPSWVSWREIEVFGIADQTEFIKVADDGWHFETSVSQQPFLPFGVNYFDPGTYHAEPYVAYDIIGAFDSTDVDRQLREIRNLGANIVRIFLTVKSFEPDLFVSNETSFQKLDKLIRIAKQHHLRIIFDLINDWEGTAPWESWELYADETTLQGYEFYLKSLGTRYSNEPAIFAWSLKNEPYVRGPDSGIMGDLWISYAHFQYGAEVNLQAAWSDYPRTGETWETIQQPDFVSEYVPLNNPGDQRMFDYQVFREDIAYNWVRRMSSALRRNDPNHMVTIGLDQHSVPIKNAVTEKTYTAFNPIKIAPLLDYISIHAYNWWDPTTVNPFIKAIARYSYIGKPVLVEEFNLRETGATILPLMDSSVGWLHWAAFDVPGLSGGDNLFDSSENRTALGNSFNNLTDWVYLATPVSASDVALVDIDLKQALTSVDYQNTRFPEYVSTFNSSGGPVGFNIINYRGPLRLGMPAVQLPEHLAIGQELVIGWGRLDWSIIPETPVSLLLSRDGGDQWETIANDVKGNSFIWTVTGPVSNQCLFRIVDKSDENIFTESAAKFSIESQVTQVQKSIDEPLAYNLYSAYPNPFNPSTTIEFSLPHESHVKLSVYNLLGEEIQTLMNEVKNRGKHSIIFNGSSLVSGIYICRIEADGFVQTRKLTLLR
ncbi:amidohydrolase family protein [candidate division KSB1 bacterium]|nr:amidohydrolase family protein [candidate division KSB1 bacterium]